MRGVADRVGLDRGDEGATRIGRAGVEMLDHPRHRGLADLGAAGGVEIDAVGAQRLELGAHGFDWKVHDAGIERARVRQKRRTA